MSSDPLALLTNVAQPAVRDGSEKACDLPAARIPTRLLDRAVDDGERRLAPRDGARYASAACMQTSFMNASWSGPAGVAPGNRVADVTVPVTSIACGTAQSTGTSVGWCVAVSMPMHVPGGQSFD